MPIAETMEFRMDLCIRYVPSGFGRDSTFFLAKYLSIYITRGSYKISRDKKSQDKNVTDFNVADSVRRDIKVLVTKTRYTVSSNLQSYDCFIR